MERETPPPPPSYDEATSQSYQSRPADDGKRSKPGPGPMKTATPAAPRIGSSPFYQSSSRSTIIERVSDSTKETFQLLDLLSLKSTSGSIDASVYPGPVEENVATQPAEFLAKTISGSISTKFLFTPGQIPLRDYRTDVSSTSGSISGAYVLGSLSSFRTTSGSIKISLLPVGGRPFGLVTHSTSGRSDIVVLPGDDIAGMKKMNLQCSSMSGTLKLRCPGDFEGRIKVETVTGKINVSGAGVKIEKDMHSPGSKVFEAIKGNGDGIISVTTTSGRVDIAIG
ncbi:hypothetical protein MMC08_005054 [Hypocenomyce scalaris]|nr:hypothetical protein [Hypocenomyce scalaris]